MGNVVTAREASVRSSVVDILGALYPDLDAEALFGRLCAVSERASGARTAELLVRDRVAELAPDWFQSNTVIGYVAYADRFGGDLGGVAEHLDYLEELGITYVHLMSVMRPRDGENDGGYAIADYRDVDRRLGSVDDLRALIAKFHERNMVVCIDVVMNHTADTHPWALEAMAGDEA